MPRKNILVLGGGGHAKSVICIARKCLSLRIVGYVDASDHGQILGVPWIGTDADLTKLKKKYSCSSAVLGVGSVDVSSRRQKICNKLRKAGFDLPPIISPSATVNESVGVGNGTVIMDGVIVNAGTRIGEACILNTGCIIDHDCTVGDFVHLAPGTTLSGGVTVKNNCLLGTGAVVIQSRRIGPDCLIGAGAVVVSDCLSPGTYVGVPASKIKTER